MELELRTIDVIKENQFPKIANEFSKWVNGEAPERRLQKAFNDIYEQTGMETDVMKITIKILLSEYTDKRSYKVNLDFGEY